MDHSDAEHRRVLEAIDKLKESEARDELGLGGLRDAFADLLFPGTSTIQTRARYFLFIPWIYRELEKKRTSARDIAHVARRAELAVASGLKATEPDAWGIIGTRAGDSVKRLPSSVYWLGLATWKIRLFDGPISSYHRAFDRVAAREVLRDDDREPLDRARPAWDPALPSPPTGFPKETTFDLRPEEADYLVDRIRRSRHDSLLALLVQASSTPECDLIWQHPGRSSWRPELQTIVEHARLLAETMHGAAWLYNVMLAEARARNDNAEHRKAIDDYRRELAKWASELKARNAAIDAWDRNAFWALIRSRTVVPQLTKEFVESWLGLRAWEHPDGGADLKAARQLIATRERQLKGSRARLSNLRALELWRGASGTSRLDFRWRSAQRILSDIHAARTTRVAHA